MNKFVFLSLALLGWIFWELSGGSEFEPKSRTHATKSDTPQQTEDAPVVARAALSVPIIKVRATPVASQGGTPAELLPASTAVNIGDDTQPETAPVVVASLATGLDAFATPGAPVLIKSDATDAAIGDSVSLALNSPQPNDFRRVRGSRVNMRGGPGTSYSVLMVLARDSEVEVLRENGSGWVKLRDPESGRIGWMSSKMLVASNR
ncbi:SH3 domain-containing protein [uncultured Shimia sp.]|uniref:SH3 domain-containing protein n=1 Tax=uncultured Shimia sp. TaxID=573152 RepID=UPI0026203CF7|nr:SH3 domain-containing protein [uncultured Shimia sp.]